jgi:hypothetical protein
MSPVVASIYCSPHPAALQIAPAARLQGFASMISRTKNCFANMIGEFTGAGIIRQYLVCGE